MVYEVSIDSRPVVFRQGVTFSWELRAGVLPVLQGWELPAHLADQLVREKAGQEVELGLGPVQVKRVLVLGNAPSGDPQTQLVVLSDVRWYWTRLWLVRDFNVRRRIGDTRVVGSGPVEARAVVPDVQYAPWSLDEGAKPFLWEAAVRNVLDEATRLRKERPPIEWVRDQGTLSGDDRIVEEVFADDGMAQGVARAVSALSGRSLYVDLEGRVHVSDAFPGAEAPMIEALPPALRGKGSLAKVDMRASRGDYRVLFDYEAEVKITVGGTQDAEGPYGENVLRVPDVELAVPAVSGKSARTVGHGTVLTHEEAYEAFGAPSGKIKGDKLSDDVVRKGYLGFVEVNYTIDVDTKQADPVWAVRMHEVLSTFRVLFRVNPRFWARVRSARAKMAAIWDPENGTRADSPVFCDYAYRPTKRGLAASTTVGFNVTSYNASVASARKAPARIRLVDEEQGVFLVEWQKDPTGASYEIAPSALESQPNIDPGSDAFVRGKSWQTRRLVSKDTFRLATILSCVPAGPNDARRLYVVNVTLDEALETLGLANADRVDATGPVQELRTRKTQARVAWTDSQDDQDRILGLFGATGEAVSATDPTLTPQTLVPINLEDELRPLAKAVAAADVVNKLDHYEGRLSVPIAPHLRPIGTVQVVSHQVRRNEAVTVLQASAPQVFVDPMSRLPASARKILAREVQP